MMDADDNDLPEDEEEILVYVEFEGLGSDTFSNEQLQLDMIGVDTDHPIMQVNGKFYEGTYEDAVGTYMFFEKDDNPPPGDPVFDVIPTLKYFDKTRKVLKMRRVFINQRTEVLGESTHSDCIPNLDTIKTAGVPPKYQEEALAFWKDIREKRMDDLNMYLQKQKIREEKKSQGIVPDSDSDEDNPFAMYKQDPEIRKTIDCQETNKKPDESLSSLRNPENSLQNDSHDTIINTVLDRDMILSNNESAAVEDPIPSTSKNDTFCTETSKVRNTVTEHKEIHFPEATRDQEELTIEAKDKDVVCNVSTDTEEPTHVEMSQTMVTADMDNNEKQETAKENNPQSHKDIDNGSEDTNKSNDSNTEEIIHNPVESTSKETSPLKLGNVVVSTDANDTKSKKMSKREAKMMEISKRLKKIAAEHQKDKTPERASTSKDSSPI